MLRWFRATARRCWQQRRSGTASSVLQTNFHAHPSGNQFPLASLTSPDSPATYRAVSGAGEENGCSVGPSSWPAVEEQAARSLFWAAWARLWVTMITVAVIS